MPEDKIRQVCQSLGYEPVEFLRASHAGSAVSVLARSVGRGEVVVRFNTAGGGDVSRPFETKAWNTRAYSTGYVTGAQSGPDAGAGSPTADNAVQLLEEMALRWSLGEMSGGIHVNQVLEFGDQGGYIYQVRPYCPLTLFHLIERQVSPNPGVLFRIVEQVWAALAFLHQGAVNQPHGALTVRNVGFTSSRIVDAGICLLDLKETVETRRAELKRRDFQDLGMLIYQLAGSLEQPVDAVDAAMRCPNASWKQLGNQEGAWKVLTKKLLEADGFPFGYDLAGAREQLLGPLLPPKASYTPVTKVRQVNGDPPYRRDHVEVAAASVPQTDFPREMEQLLSGGEYLGAMRMVLMIPEDYEPRAQVVAWGDAIADQAGEEFSGNAEFLNGLERLGGKGSHRAALRLGRSLIKTSPAEALGWLGMASNAGIAESYFYIAGIYEQGGEGVPEDSQRALEFYQASLDHHNREDWDVCYRMAALILRESGLAAKQVDAIRLLNLAHDNGHYRSTDLLAQCLAQGLGVESDEKKAFQLFADSWNRSKKRNENYYTASNNLGVCFAIGFGVRKDPAMARHYFKQGELAGHEASKKNLHALLQST